ncbi:uncharacterized protein TNCV_4079681 [Trichonephila clavipes]|nr:uncharacterized protein TNCV_4079681 [Trichonephila clavipes]
MEKEDSSTVETPEVQNTEEEKEAEKDPGQVSSLEKDLSFETISSDADSFHTSPESVSSYDSFDAESLPSSESQPDEYPGSNEARQPVNGKIKEKPRLSDRAEYLARPKKDFLDRVKFQRLDGALPEKPLPSWSVLPLPTKLPVGSYPYDITMTKLGDELYLPPTGEKMDLFDQNNYRPAMIEYESLHDPHLKSHFKKDKIRQHLKKDGFISESGRVICSLKDINDYRNYQRRIIAEKIQQQYRDQIKDEKMEHEKKIKENLAREEEKLRNARLQTNIRSYIKNAVSSIQEGSMEAQRERDRKVLNKQIRLQLKWKQSALAKEERYKRVYQQHISDKYESEEKRRAIELEMARQDVEHLEEICRRRSEETLEKKKKVLDESRSFFRVHTGYFSNIPKCIKAEFIASWRCSQSSVVSSSQR